MAHFCRVLALVLFESEDRQIMESSKILKSFELLHLRKDRMTRASFNIVELNQSLVIGMPNFLKNVVIILQILNYGPTVSEYVRNNVSGHVPLSSDILSYISGREGSSEWKHFSRLHEIASSAPAIDDSSCQASNVTATSGWGRSVPAGVTAPASSDVSSVPTSGIPPEITDSTEADDRVLRDLLSAFSANRNGPDESASNFDPISSILNVMQIAHSIGIAPSGVENYDGVMQMLISMSDPDNGGYRGRQRRSARFTPPPGADDSAYYKSFTASSARHELQFHSMVLAPHQVEVLFVMCTLLCGRRKIQVQEAFAKHGLAPVLRKMNVRMSWDAPPYEGPNPYEHIHGPSCECNPESALRVQFLRLVHNFYDRDFMNNPLKVDMLSASDSAIINEIKREILQSRARAEASILSSFDGVVVVPYSIGPIVLPIGTGLMGQIASTLMKEPSQSVYQFWLSSCIECYLRGQNEENQIYFARTGLLSHLVKHVINHNTVRQTESVLQTSFDLIGELIKYNQINVELLQIILCSSDDARTRSEPLKALDSTVENSFGTDFATPTKSVRGEINLSDYDDIYGLENLMTESVLGDSFSSFIKVVMDNIIDSNVFLRSLYLSLEEINAVNSRLFDNRKSSSARKPVVSSWVNVRRKGADDSDFGSVNNLHIPFDSSYLTHSWYQYVPNIASLQEKSSAGSILGLLGYQNQINVSRITCGEEDELDNSRRNPRQMMSTFGTGLMGAIRGIKESVLGPKSRHHDVNPSVGALNKGSDSDVSICIGACGSDDDFDGRSDSSFKTAPELDFCVTKVDTKGESSVEKESITSQINNSWIIPPEIEKLSTFLIAAKSRILLRLMSIVTLRSINHENICCMNTALLIFMFDHRRGILAETLKEVRHLATKFGKCNCRHSNSASFVASGSAISSDTKGGCLSSIENHEWETDGAGKVPQSPAKEVDPHSVESYISQSRDGCMFCKPYSRFNDNPVKMTDDATEMQTKSMVACPVMINFRQLLWYWTEYYFRRGRDRLSLEFSSHIPFSCWQDIVGKKYDCSCFNLSTKK